MKLVAKNWRVFQHYKERQPPWIKLHRGLLDDYAWACLPLASKALAPMLWLLASESQDGSIDMEVDALAFRLRVTAKEVEDGVKPLIDKGFFILASGMLADCKHDASNMLAMRLQDASPEEETKAELQSQRTKAETRKKARSVVQDVQLSVPNLDQEVWQRWVDYRKSIGKPLKPVSLNAAAADLAKHGANQAAVVEQSIAQGWQGLFPIKQASKPGKDPRFSVTRSFANVDYWEGAKPDDAI